MARARRSPTAGMRAVLLLLTATTNVYSASGATIVTTYQYNADGALAARSTSTDGHTPSTTYFTWDNFLPDNGQPSRGAVSRGNGHLIAVGVRPGLTGATSTYTYDQRERLAACSANGNPTVTYRYDAAGELAASTLPSGDRRDLYYGGSPHVTNERQESTDTSVAFLGPIRFLSDGSEQTLLAPRKDTAAIYEASSELLSSYAYDAYGSPRAPSPTGEGLSNDGASYDMRHNPFQYVGEYRDALCGTYNLRARWYLAEAQTFLTRDPVDSLHRYGYTGGNPINRSDPSGLSYRSYQRAVGRVMKKLTPWGVNTLSALPWVGPAMLIVQTSAAGAFWHDPKQSAVFGYQVLAAGVAGALEFSFADRLLGAGKAFALRNATEAATGVGQSAISATGGHQRFDQSAFWENVGMTAAAMVTARGAVGVGYRPYSLTDSDVGAMVMEHTRSYPRDRKMLVFRGRNQASSLPIFTSPLLEKFRLGSYHEAVVGAETGSENFRYTISEVGTLPQAPDLPPGAGITVERWMVQKPNVRYQFVGTYDVDPASAGLTTNPLGLHTATSAGTATYSVVSRNCHDHAAGVLAQIEAKQATYKAKPPGDVEDSRNGSIDGDLFF